MLIKEIKLENVRNLKNITIEPDQNINYFYGKNAAGKTALLEGIYLLARARSFRTPRLRELITKNKQGLRVSAKLIDQGNNIVNTGIEYDQKETRIKYRNKKILRISEQARNLPLFVFTPDSQKIITGKPKQRRNWLDWALFHVEHEYIEIWKCYHKALRQRNALLKKDATITEIYPWEKEIANFGNKLERHRKRYINHLRKEIIKEFNQTLGQIELEYTGADGKLLDILEKDREKDRRLGTTQKGPHRADVNFLIDGKKAEKILSRGQIKLYTAIITIAQAMLFIIKGKEKPVLLIDDIAAELDEENREKLIHQLGCMDIQLFINATERNLLKNQYPKQLFHVEQGTIKPV